MKKLNKNKNSLVSARLFLLNEGLLNEKIREVEYIMRKRNKYTLLVVIGSLLLTACGGSSNGSSYDSYRGVTIDEGMLEPDNVDEVVTGIEEEDTSATISTVEIEENPSFVKMGTIFTDYELGRRIWTQYEYDIDGYLYATREYDADSPAGCYEYIYDSMGNEIEYNWVGVDGTREHYTFWDYDENGNLVKETSVNLYGDDNIVTYENETDGQGNLISSTGYFNTGEVSGKSNYEYFESGAVKKENRYMEDGTLKEELFYDEHGNMLEDKYYENGELYIHTVFAYEYDENGNKTKRISLSDESQQEVTYVNYYDDWNNLIKQEYYGADGTLITATEYAYMEFDVNKPLCSLEETMALLETGAVEMSDIAEESEENENAEVPGDFDFEYLEELIFNEFTMFTHGEYGRHHMQLESVTFDELGVEAGKPYCEVILQYNSDYGTFRYRGRAFYETNLNGMLEITECRNVGYFKDNPVVDWDAVDAQNGMDTIYVNSGHYNRVVTDKYGNEDLDMNYDYTFAGITNSYGLYDENTPNGTGHGTYMFLPSDVAGYEFVLQICWNNGMAQKYYGNTLVPVHTLHPHKFELYISDIDRGISGEPLILCYPI